MTQVVTLGFRPTLKLYYQLARLRRKTRLSVSCGIGVAVDVEGHCST